MSKYKKLRKVRRQFFEGAIRVFAWVKDLSDYQEAARKRCERIEDIAYLPDGKRSHRLDIFRPKKINSLLPSLMYIHGGGFAIASKDTHRAVALAYADRGYVVFNVNYRLSPKHKFPDALEDVGYAFKWIVENARRYGGDPDRLIVGGESAGANLTLALAISSCFERDEPFAKMIWNVGVAPKVIMILCGMLQVSDPVRLYDFAPPINLFSKALDLTVARDVSKAYLGHKYHLPHQKKELADPLLILEGDAVPARPFPKTYAMCGTGDILLSDTQRLEAALKKRGLPHVVRYFPNQGHAFHLLGVGQQAKIFWRDNLKFLKAETAA